MDFEFRIDDGHSIGADLAGAGRVEVGRRGAPMGRHAGEGVVDAYGNVFGHPGLHIADGSVMPGPTGPNPSFTIAALADRFADQIIDPDRRAAEAAAS